jgi:hypothetical protein
VLVHRGETRSVFELDIPMDSDPGILHNNSLAGNLRFEFNRVLDQDTTQELIFETVAKSRVDSVLEGINSTVFAYGQTGSGWVTYYFSPLLSSLYSSQIIDYFIC